MVRAFCVNLYRGQRGASCSMATPVVILPGLVRIYKEEWLAQAFKNCIAPQRFQLGQLLPARHGACLAPALYNASADRIGLSSRALELSTGHFLGILKRENRGSSSKRPQELAERTSVSAENVRKSHWIH